MGRPHETDSRVRRVHVDFDNYIRNMRQEITTKTGRSPSDTEISRILTKMMPKPQNIIIVKEPARRRKTTMLDLIRP